MTKETKDHLDKVDRLIIEALCVLNDGRGASTNEIMSYVNTQLALEGSQPVREGS